MKFKQVCKRVYRYYDHALGGMKNTSGAFDKFALLRDYDFHSHSSTLMEGVELGGVQYFEGDVYEIDNQKPYILKLDETGVMWFKSKFRLAFPLTTIVLRKQRVVKIGNVFENPELIDYQRGE